MADGYGSMDPTPNGGAQVNHQPFVISHEPSAIRHLPFLAHPFERARQIVLLELFFQLQRLTVRQSGCEAKIAHLRTAEVEALTEAGHEHVERRLKATAGRNRPRRDAVIRVEPDLDVRPLAR